MTAGQVRRRGAEIAYDVIDITPPWIEEPQTVLLLHGVGTDRGIWSGWLPALCGRYRVVRMDLRGFGRSAVAESDANWSMAEIMADVLAVADAAGAERFHFVGESLGGTAGLALAIDHRSRLRTVTAASTAHRGGMIHHVAEWRDFIAAEGMTRWSEVMMERRFRPGVLSPDEWAWFHRVQAACSAEAVLGLAEMLVATDLSEVLGSIDTPLLLLAADRSPFVPVTVTAEIHRLVPHSEMQVFGGARHGLVFSHPRACTRPFLAFLDRHRG